MTRDTTIQTVTMISMNVHLVVVSMAVHVLMGWTALAALALTDMKMIPVVSVSVHSLLKESVNRVGLCVIVLTSLIYTLYISVIDVSLTVGSDLHLIDHC